MRGMLVFEVSNRIPLYMNKKSYQDLKHVASGGRHYYAPLVVVTYCSDRLIRVNGATGSA